MFALAPSPASAHLVQSGMGPFYDGIAHLTLSLDDLLAVVGLALLAGMHGAREGRWVLFVLPAGWILGGLAGMSRATSAAWPMATAIGLVLLGTLVAWSPRLPLLLTVALAAAIGLLHGYLNGSLAAAGGFGWPGLLGVGTAVFVLVALLSALVVTRVIEWQRIALRVAGSWIGAIGILMAGWAMRRGGM